MADNKQDIIQPTTDLNIQSMIDVPIQPEGPTPIKKEPNAYKLYNSLIEEGYTVDNIGDKDSFTKNLGDSVKADKFYSDLISEGYTENNLGKREDFISKLKYDKPKKSRIEVGENIQEDPLTLVDRSVKLLDTPEGAAESIKIKDYLNDIGYDDSEYKRMISEVSDLPKEIEELKIQRPDGTVDTPYSKKNLSKLRDNDYGTYVDKTNAIKTYFDIYKLKGVTEANKFAGEQFTSSGDFYNDVLKFNSQKENQINLINKNLEGDQRDKALERVNQSSYIWVTQNVKTIDDARGFLIERLNKRQPEMELKNVNPFENPETKFDGNLDLYSLESIENQLDPNNKVERLIFNKYKKDVNLKEAINQGGSFDDIAISFAAKENPLIQSQLDEIHELPKNYKGELVFAALNDNDVIEAAKSDPDLMKKYQEAKNGFYINHPEFAEKQVSQTISQEREDDGENNWFVNIPTQGSVDKTVEKLTAQGKLNPQQIAIYENKIKPQVGVLQSLFRGLERFGVGAAFIKESPIVTPGMAETFQNTFNKTIHNTATSIEDFASYGMAIPKTLLGIKSSNAQKIYNVLQENHDLASIVPKGKVHEIAEGTGNLLGFIVPMIFGGEAVAGTKLFNSAEAAEMATSALMFEGSNRDQALVSFPKDPIKRYLYTAVSTAGDMMLSKILPIDKIGTALTGSLKNEMKSIISNLSDKVITSSQAKKQLLASVAKKFPELVLENTKTSATMAAFGVYHNAINSLFGSNDMNISAIASEGIKSFKSNFLTTPILAGLSVYGKNNKVNGKILFEISENPEMYKKIIEEQAAINPNINAKEMQENLVNLVAVKADLDKATNLTDAQKHKYIINALGQKIYEREALNASDDVVRKDFENKAAEKRKAKEDIYNNVDKAEDFEKYDNEKESDSVKTEAENVEIIKTEQEAKPDYSEEQKIKDEDDAKSYGFDNQHEALNSIEKRTGVKYDKYEDIPKDVLKTVAEERSPETKEHIIHTEALNETIKILPEHENDARSAGLREQASEQLSESIPGTTVEATRKVEPISKYSTEQQQFIRETTDNLGGDEQARKLFDAEGLHEYGQSYENFLLGKGCG